MRTRTYYGCSADRLTVRTIQTRKEGVTFANNTAILNATRDTGADPDFIINDAVRDVRGNIVQLVDPMGIESLTSYDALGRSLIQSRTKGTLTLATESVYNHLGNELVPSVDVALSQLKTPLPSSLQLRRASSKNLPTKSTNVNLLSGACLAKQTQ